MYNLFSQCMVSVFEIHASNFSGQIGSCKPLSSVSPNYSMSQGRMAVCTVQVPRSITRLPGECPRSTQASTSHRASAIMVPHPLVGSAPVVEFLPWEFPQSKRGQEHRCKLGRNFAKDKPPPWPAFACPTGVVGRFMCHPISREKPWLVDGTGILDVCADEARVEKCTIQPHP